VSPAAVRLAVAAVLPAAAAVAMSLAAGAAAEPSAGSRPAKTLPTAPPASSDGTGIGIRAAASLPEFLPVVNSIVGSTEDVAAELAVLADLPAGILSPNGSSIRAFSVDYDGLGGRFVATATFDSQASAEDAVVFYQATLTAAGFRPVADSGVAGDDQSTRTLRFETPGSSLDDAAVDVAVTDADSAEIELTVTDAIAQDALAAFTGWAAGLPTLGDAQAIEAAIAVTTGPAQSELTLELSTTFGYVNYTPDDLAAALRQALPDGGFSLDPEADDGSGTVVALRHVAIQDLRCEIGAGEVHPATLLLSGQVRL
jgi:hypothetical protein